MSQSVAAISPRTSFVAMPATCTASVEARPRKSPFSGAKKRVQSASIRVF
jgi:hypothetical protein